MRKKTVVVASQTGRKEHEAETVEQALKDLAKQAKKGDLVLPAVLEFEGPNGTAFSITVKDADAMGEISTMGFMF